MSNDTNVRDLINMALDAADLHEEGDSSCSREHLAGMALQLATISDDILDALEGLKAALRTEAEPKKAENGGVVRLQGWDDTGKELGVVVVTFPDRNVNLSKHFDANHLKQRLGRSFFDYFTEKTTYAPRKDFEKAAQASPTCGPTALSAVTITEATPRVGFKPGHTL